MNGIAEVTSCWIYWKECVKRLHMCPWSRECQEMSMRAQAHLVITQALYWQERRP